MSRAAISTNNTKVYDWDRTLLRIQYRLKRLRQLIPSAQGRAASHFEDRDFRSRFYQKLWRQAAENLGYHYADLGYGFWSVKDRYGNEVRGRGGLLALDPQVVLNLAGNKTLSYRLLREVPGFRCPAHREFRLDKIEPALEFLAEQGGPCVVKPARDTGAGAGVITGVNGPGPLRRAAVAASLWCKDLLIEETIAGKSYRLLFLNGQFIHGVRRDPPSVVGDGRSTIGELIAAENARRLEQGSWDTLSFFLIQVDEECRSCLAAQSLTLSSVPPLGSQIAVKRVVNQNAARENIDIGDRVHSSILETGALASARLGLQLAGVDVLSSDVTRPLAENGGVINEINGSPGLHHHYLTASAGTDPASDPFIAEKLLRYCMALKL